MPFSGFSRVQMQRWEKRSGSRRNLLAKELEQEAFNKYAKTRYLAWPDFYKLCYDLGHAVRERRVYDDLIGAKGTNLTLARFNEWWKASIYPLLAKGYDTPERARALRQAIHYFQVRCPCLSFYTETYRGQGVSWEESWFKEYNMGVSNEVSQKNCQAESNEIFASVSGPRD